MRQAAGAQAHEAAEAVDRAEVEQVAVGLRRPEQHCAGRSSNEWRESVAGDLVEATDVRSRTARDPAPDEPHRAVLSRYARGGTFDAAVLRDETPGEHGREQRGSRGYADQYEQDPPATADETRPGEPDRICEPAQRGHAAETTAAGYNRARLAVPSFPPERGESGGVSRPAPSRMPESRSATASSPLCLGVQPSSSRARVVSSTGAARPRSSQSGGSGVSRAR